MFKLFRANHKYYFLSLFILASVVLYSYAPKWGFYGHKKINRLAVFTLPSDLIPFYKKHIVFVTENAVNPDERRYAVADEAPRHYIDLDIYGDSALHILPHRWDSAVAVFTKDTLMAYGIVPWHIIRMKWQLTNAFERRDLVSILKYSADIGHYIADAHVPLHTTENYNGQLTGQYGIHGFWESRLPELFSEDYNFFVGRAKIIEDLESEIWDVIAASHAAVDSVLLFEKMLSKEYQNGKKYSYEDRGATTVKVYSKNYSKDYHKALDDMVERRMRASIKFVGDMWYTCWVDAGQPDIDQLMELNFSEENKKKIKADKEKWKNRTVQSREHN